MMYQATIEIRDKYEHETFEQLISIFERHRLNKQPILGEQPQHTTEPQSQEKTAAPVQDAAVVGNIPVAKEDEITDGKMIDAFQQYALRTKKGTPELLALLKKYDATKIAGIAQKRRAEFLAEISQ